MRVAFFLFFNMNIPLCIWTCRLPLTHLWYHIWGMCMGIYIEIAFFFLALLESPWLKAKSHTITSTCAFLCESIERGVDGLARPSPPCLGLDVAMITAGNGGPLRRQQGLLSALEMSPWEMITLVWKGFVACFCEKKNIRTNQWYSRLHRCPPFFYLWPFDTVSMIILIN